MGLICVHPTFQVIFKLVGYIAIIIDYDNKNKRVLVAMHLKGDWFIVLS